MDNAIAHNWDKDVAALRITHNKVIIRIVEETGQGLYARQPLKEQYILRLLGTIQTLTLFVRLSYDEGLITERQFFSWSDRIAELGRMAAGWLTSVRQK